MANNAIPRETNETLWAAMGLIPLRKKMDNNNQVRPIGIILKIKLIIEQIVLTAIGGEKIKKLVGETQYGIKQPAGIDQIAHTLQKVYDEGKMAVLSTDYRNAYPSMMRAIIIESIMKEAPEIEGFARSSLDTNEIYFIADEEGNLLMQRKEEGVITGSAAGAFFYGVGQAGLHKLLKQDTTVQTELIAAYLDDTYFTVAPEKIPKLLEKHKEFSEKNCGLSLNANRDGTKSQSQDRRRNSSGSTNRIRGISQRFCNQLSERQTHSYQKSHGHMQQLAREMGHAISHKQNKLPAHSTNGTQTNSTTGH
jgi:hypothetical protein